MPVYLASVCAYRHHPHRSRRHYHLIRHRHHARHHHHRHCRIQPHIIVIAIVVIIVVVINIGVVSVVVVVSILPLLLPTSLSLSLVHSPDSWYFHSRQFQSSRRLEAANQRVAGTTPGARGERWIGIYCRVLARVGLRPNSPDEKDVGRWLGFGLQPVYPHTL